MAAAHVTKPIRGTVRALKEVGPASTLAASGEKKRSGLAGAGHRPDTPFDAQAEDRGTVRVGPSRVADARSVRPSPTRSYHQRCGRVGHQTAPDPMGKKTRPPPPASCLKAGPTVGVLLSERQPYGGSARRTLTARRSAALCPPHLARSVARHLLLGAPGFWGPARANAAAAHLGLRPVTPRTPHPPWHTARVLQA